MHSIELHLGLDVHKDSRTVAIAQRDPKGEVRVFGSIANCVQPWNELSSTSAKLILVRSWTSPTKRGPAVSVSLIV